MDLSDGCFTISIPKTRRQESKQLFQKVFTEYEIHAKFHSYTHVIYRRYRQFLSLKEQIKSTLHICIPGFPKKSLLHNKTALCIENRREMLNIWINEVSHLDTAAELLLTFLEIPDQKKEFILSQRQKECKISSADRCVAAFIRRLNKSDKNSTKAVQKFDNEFFEIREELSKNAIWLLLNHLIPLCGTLVVASKALDSLSKLLSRDRYRFYTDVQEAFVKLDQDHLKSMNLDLHLLKVFQGDSAEQAFQICKIIDEYAARTSSSSMFKYILNSSDEAFQVYSTWQSQELIPSQIQTKKDKSDWRCLNTNNYPGNMMICFRSAEAFFETHSSIYIESSVEKILNLILDTELRLKWDTYISGYEIVKEYEFLKHYLVWFSFPSEKGKPVDLATVCTIRIEGETTYVEYSSVKTPLITNRLGYKRVECKRSIYKIKSIGCDAERSSSFPAEYSISSNEDSTDSNRSAGDCGTKEDFLCHVTCKTQMSNELARAVCSEFSEETSHYKESLQNLKAMAEQKEGNMKTIQKVNQLRDALDRKVQKERRTSQLGPLRARYMK